MELLFVVAGIALAIAGTLVRKRDPDIAALVSFVALCCFAISLVLVVTN